MWLRDRKSVKFRLNAVQMRDVWPRNNSAGKWDDTTKHYYSPVVRVMCRKSTSASLNGIELPALVQCLTGQLPPPPISHMSPVWWVPKLIKTFSRGKILNKHGWCWQSDVRKSTDSRCLYSRCWCLFVFVVILVMQQKPLTGTIRRWQSCWIHSPNGTMLDSRHTGRQWSYERFRRSSDVSNACVPSDVVYWSNIMGKSQQRYVKKCSALKLKCYIVSILIVVRKLLDYINMINIGFCQKLMSFVSISPSEIIPRDTYQKNINKSW